MIGYHAMLYENRTKGIGVVPTYEYILLVFFFTFSHFVCILKGHNSLKIWRKSIVLEFVRAGDIVHICSLCILICKEIKMLGRKEDLICTTPDYPTTWNYPVPKPYKPITSTSQD